MAVQTRVRKIARNPARKRRVRLTPKQIKYFGTGRQRAALKANRKRKRTVKAKANTLRKRTAPRRNPPRVRTRTRVITKIKYRTRKVKAASNRKHRTRRINPAPVILTLGATNPRKRRVSMAHKKRKPSGYKIRARSRNPKRVTRARRRNTTRRRYAVRRRNPMTLFGGSGAKHTVEIVGGVLAGMAGTKFVPTLIPTSLSSMGGTTIGPVLWSGVSALPGPPA